MAALFSYCISTVALKVAGEKVIVYLSPVLEEALKTGFALALEGKVFLSHVTFGVAEAIYDVWTNEGATAYLAGIASIVSHGAFGAISQYLTYRTSSSILGIGIAALIHIVWNYKVMKFKNHR